MLKVLGCLKANQQTNQWHFDLRTRVCCMLAGPQAGKRSSQFSATNEDSLQAHHLGSQLL
jgi:hypothetical protein